MHKSIPIVFALVALFILSLCSACMSQPPLNQSSEQNAGLVQISENVESPYISFDEAKQTLKEYRPNPTNKTAGINTIYYIHGTNVDLTGNASTWIFGVRNPAGTEMLSYDRSGWMSIPWNTPTVVEEINFEEIVTPGSLFSKNTAIILSNPTSANPERRDLDLMRGIYTLTSTSAGGDRILTFNATTGELIS